MERKELQVNNPEAIADYIAQYGDYEMTVAELVQALAGLPPNMPVFASADGTSMFLNHTQVEKYAEDAPPILRLVCSETYDPPQAPPMTYDEQVALQRQRAMQLSKNIEDESKMPSMGDA